MTPQQQRFNNRYITTAEICERFNIDISTLTAWKLRGKFPTESIVVGERMKLWERDDVEGIINKINIDRIARAS